MHLPEKFLSSLESVKGFDRNSFIDIHQSGEQITSVRINPGKSSIEDTRLLVDKKIPWTEFGYYLESRPSFTFDPLFHAGCYYVQEASSMFLEEVLNQTVDLSKPLRVLDLCAAPGGKSTHLFSLLSKESILVSNEVIRSRAHILNDNIIKWGSSNVVVTNNDPKDFQRLENYFDVIVADAPCSGSGLFRREPEAITEWSEQNVMLCSQRQQRILADVLPALKNDGLLIYSTCSYSVEEDEQIADWLVREMKIEKVSFNINEDWGILESNGGYRFWPDKLKGEGFYICCFRNSKDNDPGRSFKKKISEKLTKQESDLVKKITKPGDLVYKKRANAIHAIPASLIDDVNHIFSKLNVLNAGTKIGEIIREKLIPDHALAMSLILNENMPDIELSYEESILYLKKKELRLNTDLKGWSLVKFRSHPLGWVNILPNRVNNYYPKEMRILKD